MIHNPVDSQVTSHELGGRLFRFAYALTYARAVPEERVLRIWHERELLGIITLELIGNWIPTHSFMLNWMALASGFSKEVGALCPCARLARRVAARLHFQPRFT